MPNPWDLGTAKLLEARGFPALATTSWGLAFSLGRADYQVTRDELVAHTAEIANAVAVPINVDAEGLFPNDEGGIAASECGGCRPEADSAGSLSPRSKRQSTTSSALRNRRFANCEGLRGLGPRGSSQRDAELGSVKFFAAKAREKLHSRLPPNPDRTDRRIR